jgi:hypothetical protein
VLPRISTLPRRHGRSACLTRGKSTLALWRASPCLRQACASRRGARTTKKVQAVGRTFALQHEMKHLTRVSGVVERRLSSSIDNVA